MVYSRAGLLRREGSYKTPWAPGKMQILTQQVRVGLRLCISNKLPGDAVATGPTSIH